VCRLGKQSSTSTEQTGAGWGRRASIFAALLAASAKADASCRSSLEPSANADASCCSRFAMAAAVACNISAHGTECTPYWCKHHDAPRALHALPLMRPTRWRASCATTRAYSDAQSWSARLPCVGHEVISACACSAARVRACVRAGTCEPQAAGADGRSVKAIAVAVNRDIPSAHLAHVAARDCASEDTRCRDSRA
jgi:hypothetical protein